MVSRPCKPSMARPSIAGLAISRRCRKAASVGGLFHCLMPASRRAFLINTCQNASKSSTLSADRFSGKVTTTSPSVRANRDFRTPGASGSFSFTGRGKRGAFDFTSAPYFTHVSQSEIRAVTFGLRVRSFHAALRFGPRIMEQLFTLILSGVASGRGCIHE
jgi:hypothetical protein